MRNKYLHPTHCEHCGTELVVLPDADNVCRCMQCGKAVGVICPLCGGDGFMQEADMEGDWINFGDDLVICRECLGEGWTADPSFQ